MARGVLSVTPAALRSGTFDVQAGGESPRATSG